MRWQGRQSMAFIEVELPDQGDIVLAKDVVSLTVVEELERMPTGTLVLRDPNLAYSRLIPRGSRINIAWGYTAGPEGVEFDDLSPDRIAEGLERRGLRGWVQNPSGSAGEDGQATYNLQFVGLDFRGEQNVETYDEGTKADVVRAVFERLGVARADVRFDRGNERLSADRVVRQSETDFAFLARCAREWGATLAVGFSGSGESLAAFLDPRYMGGSEVVAEMGGRRASVVGLSYKVGRRPNVFSYSWRHHEGESGVGDAASIEFVNGEPTIVRRTVEADKVVTWRLNQERIDEELDRRNAEGGLAAEGELVQEIMQAREFDEVKRFFDQVESETAPNGVGFTVECEVFGDTTAIPGTKVQFGQGFPDMFSSAEEARGLGGQVRTREEPRQVEFYVRKNTHQVSDARYVSSLEVVDAYALSPTGVELIGGSPL